MGSQCRSDLVILRAEEYQSQPNMRFGLWRDCTARGRFAAHCIGLVFESWCVRSRKKSQFTKFLSANIFANHPAHQPVNQCPATSWRLQLWFFVHMQWAISPAPAGPSIILVHWDNIYTKALSFQALTIGLTAKIFCKRCQRKQNMSSN